MLCYADVNFPHQTMEVDPVYCLGLGCVAKENAFLTLVTVRGLCYVDPFRLTLLTSASVHVTKTVNSGLT